MKIYFIKKLRIGNFIKHLNKLIEKVYRKNLLKIVHDLQIKLAFQRQLCLSITNSVIKLKMCLIQFLQQVYKAIILV